MGDKRHTDDPLVARIQAAFREQEPSSDLNAVLARAKRYLEQVQQTAKAAPARGQVAAPTVPRGRPDVASRQVDGQTAGAVVFDLGGVLIDWDPRYLYRKLLTDEAEVEEFLATVCTPEWNAEQDRGRPFAEGIAELVERHPAHAATITAYHERWPEMLAGEIAGSVEVLAELRAIGVPLYALTNWSAETFGLARERFAFLEWFDGLVVSGEERLVKPDPAFFRLLLDRFGLDPAVTVFVDDSEASVAAAAALGLDAVWFSGPERLRRDLTARGLLISAEER